MSPPQVTIIGAGLSGLTLGHCLKHKGISATIYDRATSNRLSNSGITLNSSTYQPLLSILRLDEPAFREKLAVDSQNGGSGRLSVQVSSHNSFRCHRGRLEALLGHSQNINWDKRLKDIDISAPSQRITAQFEDGISLDSECIIGCDGPHSTTRQSLVDEIKLKVLPYVVFNGRRRLSNAEYMNNLHAYLLDSVLLKTRVGDILLEISLSDDIGSHVDVSYTYSRPARDGNDCLHKPTRAIAGATEIPEEFFGELDALSSLEPPFAYIFDADNVRDDRVLHWLMRSVMPNSNEVEQLAERGVVFIGDAAHATPILGGEGANMAIQDGIDLAEHIAAHGIQDLKRFVSERCERWKVAVEESEARIFEMHATQESKM